jgi:hypothetical protein
MRKLDAEMASQFAKVAQHNIAAEYPNKLDHLMEHAGEVAAPRALHPVFFGSYDWHSSVHMHWLLVRLIGLDPSAPYAERAAHQLDQQFTAGKVAGECSYLRRHASRTFERTYGWAWLLALHGELVQLGQSLPRARVWAETLAPLAAMFRQRYLNFLPQADFAIRTGTHQNSAFGLLLARVAAEQTKDQTLVEAVDDKARSWFGNPRRYPVWLEPQGGDFLSPALAEAVLMQVVLGDAFLDWWQDFIPEEDDLQTWLTPVPVADRSDAQMSHLDGLNLSRAWSLRRLLPFVDQPHAALFASALEAHVAASLAHVADGHYVGTHWLASFATLALCEPQADRL